MKKRISLILTCALLSPMHFASAAADAHITPKQAQRRATAKSNLRSKAGKEKKPTHATKRKKTTTAGTKKTHSLTKAAGAKKTAGHKTSRAKTTTAGTKATKKEPIATKKPRTKTTTAGTKNATTKAKRKPKTTAHKATKTAPASRAKKTSYYSTKAKTRPATKPVAKKTAVTAAKKPAPVKKAAVQPKRVYRKGGRTYAHFNHLDRVAPQNLGQISQPISQTISLNAPGRGYKGANRVTFTTPDGKTGQILIDAHKLNAARAKKLGLTKIPGVGETSVQVFAGNDPKNDLALIGEFPLANANLKGNQDLQIEVSPSGEVSLLGKNDVGGFSPLTKFSIHQHNKAQ